MKVTNVTLLLGAAWWAARRRQTGGGAAVLAAAALACAWPLLLALITAGGVGFLEPVGTGEACFAAVRAAAHAALATPISDGFSPTGKTVMVASMLLGRLVPIALMAAVVGRRRHATEGATGLLPGP